MRTDQPLNDFGLSSRDAVALAAELQRLLGRPVPATSAWEFPTIDRLVDGLLAPQTPSTPSVARVVSRGEDAIAVVGIGCRLPGGVRGPAQYWDLLLAGTDAVTEVPQGRWDAFAEVAAGTTRHGGFLDDVAGFDAEFFGIAAREAELMDPQQRLLAEVTWEALEHAGMRPGALAGTRTGVYVGISGSEYAHLTTADFDGIEGWTATGAASSIAANRLSYLLDLRGPSMAVDTACSSSLVAVHLAVRGLRSGESDLALAGGVNLLLSPLITQAFDQAGGTSPDGRCRAFSAAANGMVRSEGCGVVILKRLTDARRDGDEVLAVVKGSAVNSDGRSNGLVAPSVTAQRAVVLAACTDAGVEPDAIGYVEAHGTGTALGDPIEASALSAALCRERPKWRPLLIGSAKTNVGHLEAAAGIAGFIKTVLALRHRHIPASLHFDQPNPHIDFAASGLRVAKEGTSWPATAGRIHAGVSAFGFGGTNAHAVLTTADIDAVPPPRALPAVEASAAHIVVSDDPHAAGLVSWLDQEEPALADVAHTLARRGGRHDSRIVVVAKDTGELRERLSAVAAGRTVPGVVRGSGAVGAAAPVWIFSGYQPLWKPSPQLMDAEPAFAAAVEELTPMVEQEAGLSLRAAVLGEFIPQGPQQVMPMIFGTQVALARLWRAHGVVPAAVMGHSVGEVAAAVAAGGLSAEDGARVVARRSALLSRLVGRGAMAVLGIAGEEAASTDGVHVAVYSSPEQCVVTGDRDRVAALAAQVEARGLFARVTDAEGAGHSPLVDPLLPDLLGQLDDLTPHEPVRRWYATSQPDPCAAHAFDAAYWADNLRRPVRFAQAVQAAVRDGHRVFTEVSSHPVLSHALADLVDGGVITGTLRRDMQPDDAFHTALATLHAHGRPVAPGPGGVIDVPRPAWRHIRHWVSGRPWAPRQDAPLGTHIDLPDGRHVWRRDGGTPLSSRLAAEMALAAGAKALDAAAGALTVRDLWVTQPPASGPLTTTIDPTGRVEMTERTDDGWRPAASAVVRADDGRPPVMPDLLAEKLFEMRWQPAPLDASTPDTRRRWMLLGASSTLEETVRQAGDEIAGEIDETVDAVVLVLDQVVGDPHPDRARHQVSALLDALHLIGEHRPRLWVAGSDGALRGAVRVLALEHPALHATLVETAATDELYAEVRADSAADHVAWRDGVRHTATLSRAEPTPTTTTTTTVVRPDSGYLITGGLGGLGLVTARWLAESGAARVVLNSRREPTEQIRETIEELGRSGCDVEVVTGDLAVPGTADRLIDAVGHGGLRLGGVIHAAGALHDRLALRIDEANLREAWSAKVYGGWQLHLATLDRQPDWWVAFSSAAGMLGSPGQLAYASANAWLDALMSYRRARGLPGTAVNWGTWSEIGGVAEDNRIGALRPLVPAEGIEALHALLAAGGRSAGVFAPRSDLTADFPELANLPYFRELAGDSPHRDTARTQWSSAADVTAQVQQRVAGLVGYALDRELPLLDAGLDSLAAMRMKSVLEQDFGVTVPVALLLRGASLADVEKLLVTELGLPPALPAPRRPLGARDAAERLVSRVVANILTRDSVGMRDDLFALGATDQQADRVLAELRAHVDRAIGPDELRAHPTLEGLATLVRARQRTGSGPVRTLRESGDEPPLYFAHPAGGDTAVYRELAGLLGPNRPCFGLDRMDGPGSGPGSSSSSGAGSRSGSVAERAARYAELVPPGAVLGGWSFGGVLAFETARLLSSRGIEVGPVVLLDSGLPLPLDENDTEARSVTRRLVRFGEYLTETYDRRVVFDADELAALDETERLASVRRTLRSSGVWEQMSPAIQRHQITTYLDTRALDGYQAGPYPGPVMLFRASEPTPWAVREPRFDRDDEDLGWSEHCPDLTVIKVPGHHFTLLDPPGIHVIADHLRKLTHG